jgi:2-amino-4-hydroxy-6-hydroxymethyldihydropteridine diphosphokinase
MPMTTVYLSLGSNVGDRPQNLRTAIAALDDAGVQIRRISKIYETEPVDYLEQDWFLNCVVEGETALAAAELLQGLRRIEKKMGSAKAFAKGPRIIDLDILYFADAVINSMGLQIPHPRLADRRFVLVPLAEMAPGLRHPVTQKTSAEMLLATRDRSAVRETQ